MLQVPLHFLPGLHDLPTLGPALSAFPFKHMFCFPELCISPASYPYRALEEINFSSLLELGVEGTSVFIAVVLFVLFCVLLFRYKIFMNSVSDHLDCFHNHMVLLTSIRKFSALTDTGLEGQLIKSLFSCLE